jgi:hypothetical protein
MTFDADIAIIAMVHNAIFAISVDYFTVFANDVDQVFLSDVFQITSLVDFGVSRSDAWVPEGNQDEENVPEDVDQDVHCIHVSVLEAHRLLINDG